VLLTGFEGYGGRSDNPSASIVQALDGKTIGGRLVTAKVLPVTNHNLRKNITSLIDELNPDIVLCLGLAPGENMIRLERMAANYSQFEIADNSGEKYSGEIVDGGPEGYATTLNLNNMLGALHECGIPARISQTAGTYLCNAVMYHSLDYCAARYPQTRCGFIHLPYMPSQVCNILTTTKKGGTLELHQRSDLSSMALETQIEAIRVATRSLD